MSERDWSKASHLEKAEFFASIGEPQMTASVLKGALGVSDADKRRLISLALNVSADTREQLESQGIYHMSEFENPNMTLAMVDFVRQRRTWATEILYPEVGESAEDHLKRLANYK